MFLSTDIHTHSKPVKGYYNSEGTDYEYIRNDVTKSPSTISVDGTANIK